MPTPSLPPVLSYSQLYPGLCVSYQHWNGTFDAGIVKSVAPSKLGAFVVYSFGDTPGRFEEYTAIRTPRDRLRLGWNPLAEGLDFVQYYDHLRAVPGVGLCGIRKMNFTFGLFVGLDEGGCRGRFCYKTGEDAVEALKTWNGIGDPSGPWIKYKGEGGERRPATTPQP